MKKPKVTMTVIKEETGFSASINLNNSFIGTQAEDIEELKANILDALNLTFTEEDFSFEMDDIILKPDLASFFEFYKVINAKALSERIGMSQRLLSQYINGIKKPSENQTKRILKGVQRLGKELTAIQFLL
ncbi:helix-turn-helix transcriptional regulator [Pedobacter hiemivivus]|uniref:Helix-turn-helix transcriptional regulator n=1 Tax=Pedobacter hiemivivus TaxID=2530454 RepID=A0A4U1GN00_9SPHI|nr:helix-turn-helix transcriptional regulator [Pedobacter hiemivivus]TKC65404.1 helix-turn-helix transcriptional regulator [Pedobacter hiemivivus]